VPETFVIKIDSYIGIEVSGSSGTSFDDRRSGESFQHFSLCKSMYYLYRAEAIMVMKQMQNW